MYVSSFFSPIVYRLDLREAGGYLLARRFPMHDKDVIYVANSEFRQVYRAFVALNKLVGPVETVIITCANSKC